MTQLNGTSGTTLTPSTPVTTGALGPSGSTPTSSTDSLGQNAFLKLMMTQLQDQDPLNPSDPSQYLGELAQMTSVEQETNIAQTVSQSASEQNSSTAVSLLGRTVTYTDAQGNQQSGVVQGVTFTGSGPTLNVGGTTGIDLTSVSEVS